MIATLAFWRAAALRALYTVLAAALPLLSPLVGAGWDAVRQATLGLALVALLSVATSLARLPELGDTTRSRWLAILDRTVRTFGQVLAAAFGSAAFLSEIRWSTLLAQAGAAALVTLLRAVIDELPEAIPVVSADDVDDVDPAALSPVERAMIREYRHMEGHDPLPGAPDAGPAT